MISYYIARIILLLVILGFVLSGLLNPIFYIAGRNPYELFLVILFLFLTICSIFINRFNIRLNKIDYAFFSYFICILYLPMFFNSYELIHYRGDIHVIFLSVKIYLVYRIIKEVDFIYNVDNLNQFIFDVVIIISIIAGIIGIVRLTNIAGLEVIVDYIWPTEKFPYRLTSTMSGINGGAAFFCIVSFIALHLYNKTKNKKYLIANLLLLLFVVLSGSLTSIFLMIIFYFYLFIKNFSFKMVFYSIFGGTIVVIILMNLLPFKEALEILYDERINRRVLTQSGQTFLPSTLEARVMRWDGQIARGFERPIFGHAASTSNNKLPESWFTHNYYIYLFLYTGIIGLSAFLISYIILFNRVRKYRETKYLMHILIFIFFAQGTLLILNYGGISEFFGVLLYLNQRLILR